MLYKLIVLYMLDLADVPLLTNQVTEYVLAQGYTDYITLSQSIGELLEDGFIFKSEVNGKQYLAINDFGKKTLKMFVDNISPIIRDEVKVYAESIRVKSIESRAARAEYIKEPSGEYRVILSLVEKNTNLFEVSVLVPTEETAKAMAEAWPDKNERIYYLLINSLTNRKQSED